MPSSLPIAAFVFGAVLLLVSLLSGGFKIFGAEISGTAGRTARVVAFVLGAVMLVVGLTWEESERAPAAPAVPPRAALPAPVPAPQPAAPAVAQGQLTLRWSVSSEQTGAVLMQLPDRQQLLIQAMAQQTDLHVARVVITNVGTTPVNLSPQLVAISHAGVPLPQLPLNHPAALRPMVLAPNTYADGMVMFRGPLMVIFGLLSVTYTDPAVQVTYAN